MAIVSALRKEYLDVFRFRKVIESFVTYTLRLRYRRSALGFVWTVLAPLSQYIILSIIFSWAMRVAMDNYVAYFLSGLLMFNFISVAVGRAPDIFIGNEQYIKKIYLPKTIFILNVVLLEAVNFILSFFSLGMVALFFGKIRLDWTTLYLVVPSVAVFFMLIGLCSLVGIATVYFRDMKHIIPALMLGIFYATPIIYPVDMVPVQYRFIVTVNPFYYFVENFRIPLLENRIPAVDSILIMLSLSFGIFAAGTILLAKLSNRLVFKL